MFTKQQRKGSTFHFEQLALQPLTLNKLEQLIKLETDIISIIGRKNIEVTHEENIFSRLEHLYLLHLQNRNLGLDMLDKALRILGQFQFQQRIQFLYYFAHQMSLKGCNQQDVQAKLLQCFYENMILESKSAMGYKSGLIFCQLSRNSCEIQKVITVLIGELEKEVGFTGKTLNNKMKSGASNQQCSGQGLRQIYMGRRKSKSPNNTNSVISPLISKKIQLQKYLYEAYLTGINRLQSQPKRKFYSNSLKYLRNLMMREYCGIQMQNTLNYMESNHNVALQQFINVIDCAHPLTTTNFNDKAVNSKTNNFVNIARRKSQKSWTKNKAKFSLTADTTQSLKHSFTSGQGEIYNSTIVVAQPKAETEHHHQTKLKLHLKCRSQSKFSSYYASNQSTPNSQFSQRKHENSKVSFTRRNQSSSSGIVLKFSHLPQKVKDKLELKKKKLRADIGWEQKIKINKPKMDCHKTPEACNGISQIKSIQNMSSVNDYSIVQNNQIKTFEKEQMKSISPHSLAGQIGSFLNVDQIIQNELKWVISEVKIEQKSTDKELNHQKVMPFDDISSCEEITRLNFPPKNYNNNAMCPQVYSQTIKWRQIEQIQKGSLKELSNRSQKNRYGSKIANTSDTNNQISQEKCLKSDHSILFFNQFDGQCQEKSNQNVSEIQNDVFQDDKEDNIKEQLEEDVFQGDDGGQQQQQQQINDSLVKQYIQTLINKDTRVLRNLQQQEQVSNVEGQLMTLQKDYTDVISEWVQQIQSSLLNTNNFYLQNCQIRHQLTTKLQNSLQSGLTTNKIFSSIHDMDEKSQIEEAKQTQKLQQKQNIKVKVKKASKIVTIVEDTQYCSSSCENQKNNNSQQNQTYRTLKSELTQQTIKIRYNQDYDTTQYCKTLHHWLTPELKINSDEILLTIYHPKNNKFYEKRQEINGIRTIKDESYKIVENKLIDFLKGYPQYDDLTVDRIWEEIVKEIQNLDIVPDQVMLKQVQMDNFWESHKYYISFSHAIKPNQVVARCQRRKLKSYPIDIAMNKNIDNLQRLISCQNLIIHKEQLLFKNIWVILGQRNIKIKDSYSRKNLHYTFNVYEKCKKQESLLFSYCVASIHEQLSMKFHGIKQQDRKKIWTNIDAIIGYCLKQVNHKKIVFNTHDLQRLLQLL